MKLNESEAESFELLHQSVCNALIYAEDMVSQKNNQVRDSLYPVVTKLKWIKTGLELKIPSHLRPVARGIDSLYIDEMLRLITHMNINQRNRLEQYAHTLIKKDDIPE